MDIPVAFELAVPAGLAVDCLAGALGRGTAVGSVVLGVAGDGGCAAADEAVDGRTGLLVAGDGRGRGLGVVVGHVGGLCKALGVGAVLVGQPGLDSCLMQIHPFLLIKLPDA